MSSSNSVNNTLMPNGSHILVPDSQQDSFDDSDVIPATQDVYGGAGEGDDRNESPTLLHPNAVTATDSTYTSYPTVHSQGSQKLAPSSPTAVPSAAPIASVGSWKPLSRSTVGGSPGSVRPGTVTSDSSENSVKVLDDYGNPDNLDELHEDSLNLQYNNSQTAEQIPANEDNEHADDEMVYNMETQEMPQLDVPDVLVSESAEEEAEPKQPSLSSVSDKPVPDRNVVAETPTPVKEDEGDSELEAALQTDDGSGGIAHARKLISTGKVANELAGERVSEETEIDELPRGRSGRKHADKAPAVSSPRRTGLRGGHKPDETPNDQDVEMTKSTDAEDATGKSSELEEVSPQKKRQRLGGKGKAQAKLESTADEAQLESADNVNDSENAQEEKVIPTKGRRGGSTRQQRQPEMQTEESVPEEVEPQSGKRSMRDRKTPASKSETVVSGRARRASLRSSGSDQQPDVSEVAPSTPRRGRKPQKNVERTTDEEPTRLGQRATRGATTVAAASTPKGQTTGKRGGRGGREKAAADPYDFGESDAGSDETKKPTPMKHVHAARGSFGEMKFTRADTEGKSRFAGIEKSADERRSAALAKQRSAVSDTLILSPGDISSADMTPPAMYRLIIETRKIVEKINPLTDSVTKRVVLDPKTEVVMRHTLTPQTKRMVSPKVNSLSSGELADLSSLESKGSVGSTRQRSALSSPAKSETTKATPGRIRYLANPQNIIGNDKGEDAESVEEAATSFAKSGKGRGRGGKRVSSTGTSSSARPSVTGSIALFSDADPNDAIDEPTRDDELDAFMQPKGRNAAKKTPIAASKASTAVTPRTAPARLRTHAAVATADAQQTPRSTTRRTRKAVSPGPLTQAMRAKGQEEFTLPSTPEEQSRADQSGESGVLLPGARVLARWRDGSFYPGNIVMRDGLGRYKVKYLDSNVRDMPAPDVYPLSQLKEGDVLMYNVVLEDGEEELQPVKILRCPSPSNNDEWFGGQYEVNNTTTETDEHVPWNKFVIDKDQVKHFVSSFVNKAAQDIDTSNLSDAAERRERRTRHLVPPVDVVATPVAEEQPATAPKSARSTGRGRRRKHESADDEVVDSSVKMTPLKKRARGEAPPTNVLTSGRKKPGPKPGRKRGVATTAVDAHVEESAATSDGEEERPIAQLFAGQKFVLTSANRKPTREEEDERPVIPFNKKVVRQMIEVRGGEVLDDFSNVADRYSCYLVADTHYRTHKYLSALARAIPCVSHSWIHNCCTENKLLDYKTYMLLAGTSLENHATVEWHENCPTLLADMNVFVFTQNKPAPQSLDFVQIWSPLVACMGATVVTSLDDVSELHLMLTDTTCPAEIVDEATVKGADVVSSEWLIQAIITGTKPSPDAHIKYRYDYQEPAPTV